MKEIKYIVGFGAILAVIALAVLGIFKILGSISAEQLNEDMIKTLSVIGVIALAALVISLVVRAFKSK